MKNYIVKSIRVISILIGVIGIGSIIVAFIAKREFAEFFAIGMGSLISGVLIYGFSFVVEAACLFIEKK